MNDGGTWDGTISVRELVLRRLGKAGDPWNLALVQRAEVWDQVRMRHLLDSLLAGYPVGAILLCRVRQESQSIRTVNGERIAARADPALWQLLDGQQRINAFVSMLTEQGRYGRFYLHMTVRREPPGPVQSRHTKDRALRYIAWRPVEGGEPLSDRHLYVDLSRWVDWAEEHARPGAAPIAADTAVPALHALDPAFVAALPDEAATVAAERLNALIEAWHRRSIPVLEAEVELPLDVLEVFTRINLGGVQVVGADVYFAAVKTFWTDAEARLHRLGEAAPFLTARFGTLRFVSRLASRGLGHGDLLPLSVDRLAGRSGDELRQAMQELTADDSPVPHRLHRFSAWMRTESRLGHCLRLVTRELWDDVLAWVACTDRDDEDWYGENLPLIDAYLLGATLFRYRAVMGDRFHRAAFLESLAAGAEGERFPLEQILAVARAGSGLHGNRREVATLGSDSARQAVADQNGQLLTSLAQRVPYTIDDALDWDHIFPTAASGRMWTLGKTGRRCHHPDRRLVNSAGNLWALGARANRSLKDTPPERKFAKLDEWLQSPGAGHALWERDRWSLTDDEIKRFIDVDHLLNEDPESINRGMEIFRDLVTARTARLLDDALARFPQSRLFAADAAVYAGDPTTRHDFLDALHLSRPVAVSALSQSTVPEGVEPDLGPEWTGRMSDLSWVVRTVTKALSARPTGPGPSNARADIASEGGCGSGLRRGRATWRLASRHSSWAIAGLLSGCRSTRRPKVSPPWRHAC